MTAPIAIIAALADNHVIGDDNRLIWRLKTDLKRFRALTLGRPLIMGRKTFQSIGKALPGRHSLVLTRDPAFRADGVAIAHDLATALAMAQAWAAANGADTVVVAGGADIYAQALPLADLMHLTWVHAAPGGDARFPAFSAADWSITARESHPTGADDEHPFTFVDMKRRI
jgi:dihydrofolate reductase